MSVNLAISGIPGPPISTVLTTSEADVFVPTEQGLFLSFAVANRNAAAQVVDVYWNDGTTSFNFYHKSVAAHDTTTFSDVMFPVVPSATNGNAVAKKIRAKAAVNTDLTITISFATTMSQQNIR